MTMVMRFQAIIAVLVTATYAFQVPLMMVNQEDHSRYVQHAQLLVDVQARVKLACDR